MSQRGPKVSYRRPTIGPYLMEVSLCGRGILAGAYHCKHEEDLERRDPGDCTGGVLSEKIGLVVALESSDAYATVF